MNMESKFNRGMSLIEVLVAAFIFATGILGVASLQMKGLSLLTNSGSMNAAMIGASDLIDRMQANPNGVFSGYYDSLDQDVEDPGCADTCSELEMSRKDVFTVYGQLSRELPEPTLAVVNTGNNVFTVDVTWTERIGTTSNTKRHRVSFFPYKP